MCKYSKDEPVGVNPSLDQKVLGQHGSRKKINFKLEIKTK